MCHPPEAHLDPDMVEDSTTMELRSKEELHMQHLINNLRYNLLQFNNRMMQTVIDGSPQLSLSSKSQLMSSMGILSLKIVELQQAWDQFDFAWKRAGVLWPEHFFVFFPKKRKYSLTGKEEEHQQEDEDEGFQEPKPKRVKTKPVKSHRKTKSTPRDQADTTTLPSTQLGTETSPS